MRHARKPNAAWRFLWSALRARGPDVRRLGAWSTLEALPAFLSGRLVAKAIDDGFLAGRVAIGLAWLAAFGVSALIGAWATRQAYLQLAAVVEPFRDELATLVVRSTLRRSTVAGATADTAGVARLTRQVEIVRDAFASVLIGLQSFLFTTAGALLGLFTLSPAFVALVLPPLLLGLGLFLAAIARIAARQRASIMADERISESASPVASGLRDVIACGAEDVANAMVGEHIDSQADATNDLARFTAVRTVLVALGGWLPIILILAGSPWLVRHGASTGTILGALVYVSQGLEPALTTLVRQLGGPGLWLTVTLGRILEAADESGAAVRSDAPVQLGSVQPQRHDVRLRNVTFSYSPFAEPVMASLNLTVADGEHLAIVGPSGVGKSTLARVISGMLEPEIGEVRLGGVPLRSLDPGTVTRHRVLIPQEAYVFTGTLRENLVYLADDASIDEIDDAVAELEMRALVRRLGGYDAPVAPAALSAGERQLITLARAYLSPARLSVLDEATCHLDPRTEARIEQSFARRPGTVIVIAHRISSALRASTILVLDGTQVLCGDHDTLLTHSPLYRDLVGHWQSAAAPSSAVRPRTQMRSGRNGPLEFVSRSERA
jgi:ATP-binding cassette subfamily C protein